FKGDGSETRQDSETRQTGTSARFQSLPAPRPYKKTPQLANKGKSGTNNQGASTTPISTPSIAQSGQISNLFPTK
ncbi:hypothetical protein, partial [Chamaesiphon sp. VAR_69_metabat_338]|uniref:hypothetical protein n=1 Tax=Chamaesiphon sp. VAR_69_metabat_338 TaxID=2964704 RepID=UPI00286E66E5